MKPYYQDALITIYWYDSRDLLPHLDGYNVVMTDPPWLTKTTAPIAGGDRPAALLAEVFAAIAAPVDRLIVQLGSCADPRILSAVPSRFPFLVACAMRRIPPGYRGNVVQWGELAYVFGGTHRADNGKKLMPALMDIPTNCEDLKRSAHPCARFLRGAQWLVGNYCRTTDVILDPFMGSGTTLLAAKYGGRKAIGIEIEERWCEEAAAAMSQRTFEEAMG